MPTIQGFNRFRKHQVGKQSSIASNTTATRRLPFRGPITVEPNRTTPDVDTGSLDPLMAAFLGPRDITGTWEGKAAFNDMPYLWAGMLKGGVTPTGSVAKTWVFQAASLTADDFEYYTDEWGDDVATDSIVAGGGVIENATLSFGDDLAAWDVNADLVYARVAFGTGFTGGLSVDETPNWMYGAHTVVYMDSAPGAIGITPILDAIHGVEWTYSGNYDRKRYANGSNSGFDLAGFGRGAREIMLKLTLAKTAQTVAEAQTLDDEVVPVRYFDVKTTSTEMVTGSTPFSNSIRMPGELISREDGEIGGNSTITLTYRCKYDGTLGYAIRAAVVCELAAL
jgi:hypothetical protein